MQVLIGVRTGLLLQYQCALDASSGAFRQIKVSYPNFHPFQEVHFPMGCSARLC